jgi:putative tryptophan/tyrosine transport system substrate-binding protein
MIGRRTMLVASPLAAVSAIARAQAAAPTIGILLASPVGNMREEISALSEGLAELGWRGARAPRLVVLSADDDPTRLPALAAALIAEAPAAVVTQLSEPAAALAALNSTVPIVMATGSSVIELGLTASLARPTRNVTGFSNLTVELNAKRLELLLDVLPSARRIGLLWDPAANAGAAQHAENVRAAARAAVALVELPVSADGDIAPAFDRAAAAGVEALTVVPAPVIGSNIDFIVEQAIARRWPAVFGYITFGRHGGLITYAVDSTASYRAAARYVDRLLRGAKVADLPFQDPARIALIVNLVTARRMGLALPPSLLARADEVIE